MNKRFESAYGETACSVTLESDSAPDLMKYILIGHVSSDDPLPSDEPTNERIDRIEDVQPGDLLSIGKGLFTVSGIVKKITGGSFDAKVFDVFFEETVLGLLCGRRRVRDAAPPRPLGHTDEEGPQAAGDDEPESSQPDMLRITNVHELRHGDRVHLHKGDMKIEGVYDSMRSGENRDKDAVDIVFTDMPGFIESYTVADKPSVWSWSFDYAERRPYDSWTQDDLPTEPGFYRAASGSVWKYDGKLYAPVLDSKGKLAPATGTPTVGAGTFLKRSLAAHRFPFVRVDVNVCMYRPGADE